MMQLICIRRNYCSFWCKAICLFVCLSESHMNCTRTHFCCKAYVSLRLRVQNRRTKWNFPLNFRTMRKLSDLYSGLFQTQSSGCASGVDLFRNFTKLKILNIWIVKYLLNCKRYLSYNFQIFQKISECWVLENLDVHLERTTSELEFWNFQHAFLQFSEHTEISTCFFTVFRTCWKFQHVFL